MQSPTMYFTRLFDSDTSLEQREALIEDSHADLVVELVCGQPNVLKGSVPKRMPAMISTMPPPNLEDSWA